MQFNGSRAYAKAPSGSDEHWHQPQLVFAHPSEIIPHCFGQPPLHQVVTQGLGVVNYPQVYRAQPRAERRFLACRIGLTLGSQQNLAVLPSIWMAMYHSRQC